MASEQIPPNISKKQTLPPKAIIHKQFGTQARYLVEEVQEFVKNGCPGLVIKQQAHRLYKCRLDLPGLSVTSEAFTRKKDAENSAAEIAIDKLGIQTEKANPSPEEAWNELMSRLEGIFGEEVILKFISTSHPLVSHISCAVKKNVGVPTSAVLACDMKISNLCKLVNPKAESDPFLSMSLVMKAANMSKATLLNGGGFYLSKPIPYSSEPLRSLFSHNSDSLDRKKIKAVWIPQSTDKEIEVLTFHVSVDDYYLDEFAKKLEVKDSSLVVVSRTVGKASSEMKLYFAAPGNPLSLASDSSTVIFSNIEEPLHLLPTLNSRASYLSAQKIFGDAILANVGYTWRSSALYSEDVSLCTYYKLLLKKIPDGYYKLSREALLAAKLPKVFTTRANWRGCYPRDILGVYCHQHRLSDPVFSVKCINSSETQPPESEIKNADNTVDIKSNVQQTDRMTPTGDIGDTEKMRTLICEVKLLSKGLESILECSLEGSFTKEFDVIQAASLKVVNLLNEYMHMPEERFFQMTSSTISDLGNSSPEFVDHLSLSRIKMSFVGGRNFVDILSMPITNTNNGMVNFDIDGAESSVFSTPGSLACISYAVALLFREESLRIPLENNDGIEFEIGTGCVIDEIEECVTHLCVNQTAKFTMQVSPRDLINVAAAAGESVSKILQLPLHKCFLEYSVKLLYVTEPLEDRMEKALFDPPLSKQRVDFALKHINESNATTLVDFGCGSGSLLDALLSHTSTLEKIIGVDISQKGLTRAAKTLHSKLSKTTIKGSGISSAVLYDGSITQFDSRLYGVDIGTCLEVIEHMEENQANLFGEVALSLFCPAILIVSTPNYEYNPILQRSSLANKDDTEERLEGCRFRVHDHKFEWTRKQFEQWANELASKHDYDVEFGGVGGSGDVEPGFATQIAIFRRKASNCFEKFHNPAETSQPFKLVWEWTNTATENLTGFSADLVSRPA